MTASNTRPETVDEYIASFEPDVRDILREIRATVKAAAPNAREVISYRMPALKQNGVLVYFAAFKSHIGFYPPIVGNARLERQASRYAGEKGNLRFPLSEPVPYKLIFALTRFRAEQDAKRAKARQPRR